MGPISVIHYISPGCVAGLLSVEGAEFDLVYPRRPFLEPEICAFV